MSTSISETPVYKVWAQAESGSEFGVEQFQGDDAFEKAQSHGDQLKANSDSHDILITTLKDGEWLYVETLMLDEGRWVAVEWDGEYVTQ